MFDKSKPNPLADAARKIMESNAKDRQVIAELNQKLGIQDRRQLPNEKLASYDKLLGETLAKPALLKEENLQELSKDTLGSYIGKALDKKKQWKKSSDETAEYRKDVAFKNSVDAMKFPDMKKSPKEMTQIKSHLTKEVKRTAKLSAKRDPSINLAMKKYIMKEQAKLEESKATSYEGDDHLANKKRRLSESLRAPSFKIILEKVRNLSEAGGNYAPPKPINDPGPSAVPAPIKMDPVGTGPAPISTLTKSVAAAGPTTSLQLVPGKTINTSGAATSALQAPTNTNTPVADKAAAAPTAVKIDANPDVIKVNNANALDKAKAIKADNDPRAETTYSQQKASTARGISDADDTPKAPMNTSPKDSKDDVAPSTPAVKEPFKFNSKGGKVSAAELEAYRKHTGKNVSLGQYMNARDGKRAVKGGKNDFTPDPYLKEGKKPYRTMTSIVESIQNKDYLNESNT